MGVNLQVLSKEDAEQARQWRNDSLVSLRTPFMLTAEMQAKFYEDVVCNRHSNARFWGVHTDHLIGMGGLFIEWENRLAEISLILCPEEKGKGYGEKAVDLLLNEGFGHLNLQNIYGECYYCNPAVEFWNKIIKKYNAQTAVLPKRKYWNGKYWDSLYFNIGR